MNTASGRLAKVGPWAVAVGLVVAAAMLALRQQNVRDLEAWVSAIVLRVVQLFPAARSIGVAVIFPLGNATVGFSVAANCTAALLISPFLLLAAILVASRRVSVRRGVGTSLVLAVILFAVNQARILVIALSMRLWGFETGYEVSHVLLGTVVSTLGVLAGLYVYARTVVGGRLITGLDG